MKKLSLLLIFGLLGACHGTPKQPQPTLLVAAASDLVKALPELGADFESRSRVKVVPSFGASGILAQQIIHGAPFAVFLSADRQYVDQLVKAGHVEAGSRRVYARGRLVVWSAKLPVTGLADLAGPQFRRIAMANPAYAPYGRAARQALERSGLWTRVEPKMVVAQSIRHALAMAESGNAEAALTALSLVSAGWLVPESLHDPLEQEAAVVTKADGEAQQFLDYLTSEPARAILSKYGFNFPE